MEDRFSGERQIRMAMVVTQIIVPLLAISFIVIYFIIGAMLNNVASDVDHHLGDH